MRNVFPLYSKSTKLYIILVSVALTGFLFAAWSDFYAGNYLLMSSRLLLFTFLGFMFYVSISGKSKFRPRIELFNDRIFVKFGLFETSKDIPWENIKEMKVSPMAITLINNEGKTDYIYIPEKMAHFDELQTRLIEISKQRSIKMLG